MEQRVSAVEVELARLQKELAEYKFAQVAAFTRLQDEVRGERIVLSKQIEEMRAELTGLVKERVNSERAQLRREVELKSGEIAKLQAQVQQSTFWNFLQNRLMPLMSLVIAIGVVAGILWAIFRYGVLNVK